MQKQKGRTFLHDAVDTVALSTHSLESDDFTRCFQPKSRMEMDSSGVFYFFSFIIRYFILFPIRLILLTLALLVYAILISGALIYNSENKMDFAYVFIIKAVNFILGTRITHHGEKKKLRSHHIFISNHTSFLDFFLLSSYKFPHACVSENHGGLFYFFFQLILSRNGSIAFKRCEKLDRSLVKSRMIEHISKKKLPMLVFPEGTCVNNEYTVMFQKGVFELDIDVCPVAIKYKRRLLDPYWNRRAHGFTFHLFYLLTRWYIEADVYWMPPTKRQPDETPVEFANRAKLLISEKAGLRNSLWNGYLKSSPAIKDRDLLKVAFRMTYLNRENLKGNCLQGSRSSEDGESCSSLGHGKFYSDNQIDQTSYLDINIYGNIPYKTFINEMNKEYHLLKCMPYNEQHVLILDLLNKSSSINFSHMPKKGCSCRKKAFRYLKKKHGFRNCRLDMLNGKL